LVNTERIKLKEASCRQIIKLFAEDKRKEGKGGKTPGDGGGTTAGGGPTPGGGPGGSSKNEEESTKIEFINLVEPLIQTMRDSNFNLASLSASALVNLCSYSDDIKDIFIQMNGLIAILEYLKCKEEDTLHNVLRLFLALIAKSESITKIIIEENNNEAIRALLSILKGPSIPNTKFSYRITFFALTIMRALMNSSSIPKVLFIEDTQATSAVLNILKDS
jgi:hypothetical protein